MKYSVAPATIAVMTGVVSKRVLFVSSMAEQWQSFERRQGLAEFRKRFVSFPHRMVVVAPEFANFDARFNQTFVYCPMESIAGPKRRRTAWSMETVAFFQRCLAKISPGRAASGQAAEVAYVDGRCLVDDGGRWTESFAVLENRAEVISKETCADRILPALAAGIGPDEGGVYAPHGGDGVFMLASV